MGRNKKKDDWKKSEKNNKTTALKVLNTKNAKYILIMFQKIIQITKSNLFFS